MSNSEGLPVRVGLWRNCWGGMLLVLALLLAGCSQDKAAGVKVFSKGDAWKVLKENGVQAGDAKLYVWGNGYQVMIILVAEDQDKSLFLVDANGKLIDRPKNKDAFLRTNLSSLTLEKEKKATGLDMTGRYKVDLSRDKPFSTWIELTSVQGPPEEPIRIHAEPWAPESCIVINDNDVWFFHEDPQVHQRPSYRKYLKHYVRTDPSANWQIEEINLGDAWLEGCDKAGKRILIYRDASNLLQWNRRSQSVVDLATMKETKVHVMGDGPRVFME